MRIRRLDLTRFGRFTDLSLDFGEASTDPDLHLVYGPNEAGKSTIFTAFLDLLYGIHPQSPYNFLHPHPTMRISAALEIAGMTREFVRIKRPSNSLLDAEGRPLAESTIQAELGGVGREAYRSMFSLDDDSLEAGGKAILESRGDLGELLFSATSGLADLRRSLDGVVAKADKYYRFRANQGELLTLKARLEDLKTQREAIDTAAGTYRKLLETRDRETEAYESAVKGRGLLQSRLDRVVASLGALPRLAALHHMHAELVSLLALPQAPKGWIDDVPVLQSETVRLATLTQTVAGEIERLEAEIAKMAPDEASLRLADRIELLAASRARAFTAKKDLPERRLSLRAIDATVDGIVARLDRAKEDDPSRLVLSTAEVGTLQALIEARSGIDAALTSAADEHAAAIRRLAEARAKVAEIVEDPGVDLKKTPSPLPVLLRALRTARSSDHASRARNAERVAIRTSRAVADGLGGLHPFKGSLDDLVRSEVPANEVLDGWRDRIAGLTTKRAQLVDAQETCEREVARLGAESEAIVRAEAPVSEGQAAKLRTARERAWADHRSRLDANSADAFEDAMRRDDAIGDRRLSDMADREKLRQIEKTVAAAQFDRASALSQLDAIAKERGSIDAEMSAAWGRATGDAAAPHTPREFARWIERRDDVLKVRLELLDAQADLTEAVDDQTRATRDLRQALSEAFIPFDADDSFEKLIAIGQEAVDAETRVSGLRSKEAECARELVDRAAALATASSKEEAWARDWQRACAACWLGDAGAEPGLAAVREALAALSPLGAALQNQTALNDRISKMERDLGAFTKETSVFALEIDEPIGDDAFEVAGRVTSRVTAALDDSRTREKLITDLDAARKRQRDLAEQTVVTARRVQDMTARYNVADLVAVFERLKDAGRRSTLENEVRATEREISDLMGVAEIEDAKRLLEAVDRDSLERERGELRIRLEDEDKRCHELFAVSSAAAEKVATIGADEKVAMIAERRRTTLLEIEEGARRYLRLRAGVVAMEHALKLHRDRSRGTMITEASEAFATMSRGTYSSLATQPHKDKETLIARASAGGSKSADQLSKGTRFQLYLSLRVAGYLEIARTRATVPFVGDDIMESFDDFRAEETLKLFAKMAGVGQVVYFTHHRHLIPIAREVCPTLRVHELQSAKTAAA